METLSAFLILIKLSMVIFFSPRSTAPIYVLCNPTSNASCSCDKFRDNRSDLILFPISISVLFLLVFILLSCYYEHYKSTDYKYHVDYECSMNKNLKNYIIKSDIPDDLKEYLSKSKNTYNLLSMKIIDDIELIYLEFNTLYIFDLSEFNSIIIESLHKKDKY